MALFFNLYSNSKIIHPIPSDFQPVMPQTGGMRFVNQKQTAMCPEIGEFDLLVL
jgi:hypothetical protein